MLFISVKLIINLSACGHEKGKICNRFCLIVKRMEMRKQGLPEKEIAYTLHNKRRELGKIYKEAAPLLLQEYIYVATVNKYGDPLGPTFEQLSERKTYAEIIESSSRPIEDLDNRLTVDGFVEWYRKEEWVI